MGPKHIPQTLTNAMGPSSTKWDGERQAVWLAQPGGRVPELSLCWDQWGGAGVYRSQWRGCLWKPGFLWPCQDWPSGTLLHRLRMVPHGGGSGWHRAEPAPPGTSVKTVHC